MLSLSRLDPAHRPFCIRWTIGDVSPAGFEALRLSIAGARRLFGSAPTYVVCVNTLGLAEARRRAGPMPAWLHWRQIEGRVPIFLQPHLGEDMSEGTGWKLIPPRLVEGADELALDNDVILWDMPEALRSWLAGGRRGRVIAADVSEGHGRFARLCGPEPRNSGIRAIPAEFDYAGVLAAVLAENPGPLTSELDEQGLQVAALSRRAKPLVVTTEEVSICSPFPPHDHGLGSCGAHFVGLNARDFPWEFYGRRAIDVRLEHWQQFRPELYDRLGLPLPGARRRGGVGEALPGAFA